MDEPVVPGDIEGFCAEWFPRVTGMLALYVGCQAVAEELAQEALARAWERWPAVCGMDNPVGWLHVTALNLARSRFRRRGAWSRARSKLYDSAATNDLDPSDRLAVSSAINALPHRQRQVVLLRFYLDMPTAEKRGGCGDLTVDGQSPPESSARPASRRRIGGGQR